MKIRVFNKINFVTLGGFGSHYGPLLSGSKWNVQCSAYVHSRINDRFFINLSYSSLSLSRSLKFLSFCSSRRLRSLFFFKEGFLQFIHKMHHSLEFWSKNFFIVSKWVPGVLTNYVSVRSKLVFSSNTNMRVFPNLVIFLDSNRFWDVVARETRLVKLPSLGLSDLDMGYVPFSYTIPSNNKSFGTLYSYYKIFFSSIRQGYCSMNYLSSEKGFFYIKRLLKGWFFFKHAQYRFFQKVGSSIQGVNISSFRNRWFFSRLISLSFFKGNSLNFQKLPINPLYFGFSRGLSRWKVLRRFFNSFMFFVINRGFVPLQKIPSVSDFKAKGLLASIPVSAAIAREKKIKIGGSRLVRKKKASEDQVKKKTSVIANNSAKRKNRDRRKNFKLFFFILKYKVKFH